MKRYVMEFIGTFFLVLTIGMVVLHPGAGELAPIAIGAALMAVIYAGGHVSGAHYNPAVTLAVWMRGRCPSSDLPGYLIAQFFATGAAAIIVMALKGDRGGSPADIEIGRSLIAEFIGTFLLAFVILNVATAKATAGNSYYGLAIGFTVTAMAYAFGGISGGAFNPAVAVGLTIMQLAKASNLWLYFLANLAGGAAAALAFNWMNPEEPQATEKAPQ